MDHSRPTSVRKALSVKRKQRSSQDRSSKDFDTSIKASYFIGNSSSCSSNDENTCCLSKDFSIVYPFFFCSSRRNLKAANVMLLSDEEQIKISNLEINSSSAMLKKNQPKITEPTGIT